jgi:hypothetical protein
MGTCTHARQKEIVSLERPSGETTDHFAALGLERSPLLPGILVAETVRQLQARYHADGPEGDSDRFQAVTAAAEALRTPGRVLRHYLELQSPGAKWTPPDVSDDLSEVFVQVCTVRQQAAACAGNRVTPDSALSRALAARQAVAASAELAKVETQLRAEMDCLVASIPEGNMAEFGQSCAKLLFLEKWTETVRECRLLLAGAHG